MSFAEQRHKSYGQSQNRGHEGIFFTLSINGENHPSPDKNFVTQDGREIYGHYEFVQFLTPFMKTPIFTYHDAIGSNYDKILSFVNVDQDCPLLEKFWQERELYGQNWKDMKTVNPSAEELVFPVLLLRHVQDKHRYKAKFEIEPIYWFSVQVTHHNEERHNQYKYFEEMNQSFPLESCVFELFKTAKEPKKKTQYFLQPRQDVDVKPYLAACTHPIIQQWWDIQNGKPLWNDDYFDLIYLLAMLRYKPYIYPDTGQPANYNGLYTRALETFEAVKQVWPAAKKELPKQEPSPYMQHQQSSNPLAGQQQYTQRVQTSPYNPQQPVTPRLAPF